MDSIYSTFWASSLLFKNMASQFKLNLQFNMFQAASLPPPFDRQSLPKKVPVTCLGHTCDGVLGCCAQCKVRQGRQGWAPLHQPQKQPTSASDDHNCHPSMVVTAHILNATTPSNSGNGKPREGMSPQGHFFFPSRTMKVLIFPLQM